jgi:hypothetical protein
MEGHYVSFPACNRFVVEYETTSARAGFRLFTGTAALFGMGGHQLQSLVGSRRSRALAFNFFVASKLFVTIKNLILQKGTCRSGTSIEAGSFTNFLFWFSSTWFWMKAGQTGTLSGARRAVLRARAKVAY